MDYDGLSNSVDITMSQNTGRRQMASMWKEDFQDLSLFCQESVEQSNITKSTSIGRGNLTVPDDELNTPDLGVGNEDFNIDSWTWPQPESIDDLNLWDDNILQKKSYDNHIENDRMLDAETFGELREETNQSCVNIVTNLGEDSLQQKAHLCSDVNNETYDKIYAPEDIILEEECEVIEEVAIVQENEFSSVFNNQTCNEIEIVQNDEVLGQVNMSENFNPIAHNEIIEVKETPIKNLRHPAVTSNTQAKRSGLHLALTMENPADVLNTPEVLARLDSQSDFDLLRFVLEDNSGLGPSTASDSSNEITHPTPSSYFEMGGLTVKQEMVMETPLEENAPREESAHSSNGSLTTDCQSAHYLVAPSNSKSSEICLVLKKTPSAKRRSSSRTESECCDEKIEIYMKEEVDSSDDYEPPEKVKRNSRSKRTKSECSRYRELRNRNNEASRRSRQNRKVKEEETKSQLATLESENQRLKIRAEELEKLVGTLRNSLLNAAVTGRD